MLEIKAMIRKDGLEQEVVIISFESFSGEGYCLCMNENGVIFHVKNEYITITDKKYLEACAKGSIDIELADFMNKVDKRLDRVQCQQLTNIICELDEYRKKIEKGTLIELPCKVGDKFWCINETKYGSPFVMEMTVDYFKIINGVFYMGHFNCFRIVAWQKSELFNTREEAEKKLQELQNG
jgi:hypothetical protein